ncbi:unnamed protein product [Paramecium octaurelia]|uniref:Uncharacterized protein n=1 Tax=Paramecium octaurelia TaxID=43137 RepID=A0A8S1TMU9_PAROT|nr:unnamed protein product [Paramecium octaurelia]
MINKQTEQIFSQLQGAFGQVERRKEKKPMKLEYINQGIALQMINNKSKGGLEGTQVFIRIKQDGSKRIGYNFMTISKTKQIIAHLKQSPSYKQVYLDLDFEQYVKEG